MGGEKNSYFPLDFPARLIDSAVFPSLLSRKKHDGDVHLARSFKSSFNIVLISLSKRLGAAARVTICVEIVVVGGLTFGKRSSGEDGPLCRVNGANTTAPTL